MPGITARIGFRGIALTFLAFVWLAVGTRLIAGADPDPFHKLPIEYLPIEIRVLLWWVPAGIALAAAWLHQMSTRVGFIALVLPAAFRCMSFIGAFIGSALNDDYPFWVFALVEAVVWAGVTGYVMVVAGWPDPPSHGEAGQ